MESQVGGDMAENDSKRYYWLKLKKDFFQQHQIKVLKSLPNGRLYALIYLELLAESTSHEGELRYSQLLPYDIITLSAVIDEDKDNVEKAIETLINLELIEMLDDGTIFMREVQKLIGSETGQTIRKREAKLNNGKSVVKHTLEYRDKSKEIRDKNIYIVKHKYGEYSNVLLSDEEMEKLKQEFPNDYLNRIDRVSEYCASTGKSYKNYLATIRNWAKKDKPKEDNIPVYDTTNNPQYDEDRFNEIMKRRENVSK